MWREPKEHTTLDPKRYALDRVGGKDSNKSLLALLDLDEFLTSGHHVLVLDTHDTTTPLSGQVGVVIELSLEHGGHLFEVNNILAADISDSDAGGGLEVAELSKVGLSTDEAEGDTLLAAESGKMDDELDGVDVVGNDDKLGLVLLNESGHMVETKLEVHGLLTLVATFASLGLASHSRGLLSAGLRHVLGHQFNELGRCISDHNY